MPSAAAPKAPLIGPLAAACLAFAAACDRGPSCEEVADRMVDIANAPMADDDEEATKPEAAAALEQACDREQWPADIRRCVVSADDQEDVTGCMRDLAPGE